MPEVEIHRFALAVSGADVAGCAALLSADEHERARHFLRAADRRRFVVARARLRIVLARHGTESARELRFAYGRHGKPWLPAQPALRFNLSHAGDAAVVVVARAREVGIDLECLRRGRDLTDVARRFFSPAERRALARIAAADRPSTILRCWCRKEAYLKARGDGLMRALDSFDVVADAVPSTGSLLVATRPDASEAAAWDLRDVPVDAGYVAALAIQRRGGGDRADHAHRDDPKGR